MLKDLLKIQNNNYNHWIIIVCLVFLLIYLTKLFKPLNIKRKRTNLGYLAYLPLILEIFKDVYHISNGTFNNWYLPLHLCGLSMFFIIYQNHKRSNSSFALIFSLTLSGAILALIFPDWLRMSLFAYDSFNGYVYHFILVVYSVFMIYSYDYHYKKEEFTKLKIYFAIITFSIYLINEKLGTNYMFTDHGSVNSPLVPIYNLLGFAYPYFMIFMYLVLIKIMETILYHSKINDSKTDDKND